MNNGVIYFVLLFVIISSFYIYQKIVKAGRQASLTEEAVKPDLLLANSRTYLREHAYDRSISQLNKAIQAMREIEIDLDRKDKVVLENSIDELMLIYEELKADSLVMEDMDHAYSRALNSLTYAEIKVSEILLDHDDSHDAIIALKYGMMHLKNALRYTDGSKKDYEIHIYEEIDSLIHNKTLTNEQIKERLEELIHELDKLVVDKAHDEFEKDSVN